MTLSDAPERRRALTELDTTLLVEAAAGTGKTAILAGRVVALLAAGRDPAEIAAITFTELAAGELSQRIRDFVEALVAGRMPDGLELAFPEGVTARQREALQTALSRLDELTATTIHGFCRSLILAHAVEADVDPGAAVLDAGQADALFDEVLVRWLGRRLAAEQSSDDDPIAVLATDDPLHVMKTVRELAQLRRAHRTARTPAVDLTRRPDIDFTEAVRAFGLWCAGAPKEPKTAGILRQLTTLAEVFEDALAPPTSYARLLELSRPPHQTEVMRARWTLGWKVYACKSAWRAIARDDGERLNAEAEAHYAHCEATFNDLIGQIAARMAGGLAAALDEPLADYDAAKRAAAALDFDDLPARARRLLRDHETARQAIARRYRFILVDEFQDTDPLQAEIIFNIVAASRPDAWLQADIVPGALFLVGDPKQAIYGFRGADPTIYRDVRAALEARDAESVIQLKDNFRSAPAILEHVNTCFATPFSKPGQADYVALHPTRPRSDDPLSGAARLEVFAPPTSSVDEHRDEEARAVARLCRKLVGTLQIQRAGGRVSALRPGDIALLAPTGTGLWAYERALEDEGLSVASQAGKTLMLRQETQDVLALLRTLADPLDTLAFGALMRGPLVGLTETQLLAITAALPPERRPFSLRTRPEEVTDPVAREVLETLRALRRRASGATPAALLAEAIERLTVRVAIALRMRGRRARALANIGALQQMAKAFAVRGLRAFVAHLQAAWEGPDDLMEGRSDEDAEAVSLVTIHSSKGLEWSVVIPINTSTGLREPNRFIHRRLDDTLHWTIGGLQPPDLPIAKAQQSVADAFERERLLYVACTRARDLLVLPKLPPLARDTWSGVVDLVHTRLPPIDLDALPEPAEISTRDPPNRQDAATFAAEAQRARAAAPPIVWRRPSDADPDRRAETELAGSVDDEITDDVAITGAGRLRGVLIHKLLEEILTGEVTDEAEALLARAQVLMVQLAPPGPDAAIGLPDASECAATVRRALALPEIAPLRASLRAELPAYGMAADGALVAARADAVTIDEHGVDVVIDWKSDIAPSAEDRAEHARQVGDYLSLFGARRGALVYVSRDEVVWVGVRGAA